MVDSRLTTAHAGLDFLHVGHAHLGMILGEAR
jgi:hypothetical protein